MLCSQCWSWRDWAVTFFFPFPLFLDNSINFLFVSICFELCGAGNISQRGAVKCTEFCPPGSWLQCSKCDDVLCVPLAGQPWEERTSGGAGGARTQGESLGWRLSPCTKLSPNRVLTTHREGWDHLLLIKCSVGLWRLR